LRRGLGDNIKMDLREKDYEDQMDGGRNWLEIVTIRGCDVSVFCCQSFWLVHSLINYLEENHKYIQYNNLIGPGIV
jgi:hypothetical protein